MTDTRSLAEIYKQKAETDENRDPCKASYLKLLTLRAKGYVPHDINSFEVRNESMNNEMKAETLNAAPSLKMAAACNVLNRNFLPYVRGIAGLFTLSAESSLGKKTPIETAQLSVQRLDEVNTRMAKCYAKFYPHNATVAANIQEAQKIQQEIAAFRDLYPKCLAKRN